MNANFNHRALGMPVVALLLALIALFAALTLSPQKATALTSSSFGGPSLVQSSVAENDARGVERRLLYDDVVDTYRLFTGIAGGTFLQDYYFGETTKGLAYRSTMSERPQPFLGR